MKKFLTKTGLLGLPQKGQKQVAYLQHNALTCSYIPSSLCRITAQTEFWM